MSKQTDTPLYWESTYEIVLQLMHHYPEQNLDVLGLGELQAMILGLPRFADDPRLVNEGILNEILREWYEEAVNS